MPFPLAARFPIYPRQHQNPLRGEAGGCQRWGACGAGYRESSHGRDRAGEEPAAPAPPAGAGAVAAGGPTVAAGGISAKTVHPWILRYIKPSQTRHTVAVTSKAQLLPVI